LLVIWNQVATGASGADDSVWGEREAVAGEVICMLKNAVLPEVESD